MRLVFETGNIEAIIEALFKKSGCAEDYQEEGFKFLLRLFLENCCDESELMSVYEIDNMIEGNELFTNVNIERLNKDLIEFFDPRRQISNALGYASDCLKYFDEPCEIDREDADRAMDAIKIIDIALKSLNKWNFVRKKRED